MKKPKRWRVVKAWHPHEWVSFKEAWQRAEAVIGSSLWLIQHDLRQDFLEKRLIAAVRRIASDGTETRIILKPDYWQQLKINYAWSITGWEAREGERCVFVVRRRELDRRYPIATLGRPAADAKPSAASETTGEQEDARPTPQRRKPVPPAPKQPTASKSREQEACRQFAVRKYPRGYKSIRTRVIMHAADQDKQFKQTVVPIPKRDVWLRALGRRKS